MSSDPIDNCRTCGTPLCGMERMEDQCPACLAERPSPDFQTARARYDAEAEAFTMALEKEIVRLVVARHPGADTLHVRGEYSADGFRLIAVRVTAAGLAVDGADTVADGLEDGVGGLLEWLGELTADAYEGDHQLALVGDTGATP
ncbi:MAG: hypothetical protein M3256_08635 [Actinomycetota bacterium]|nr:hypothetical protein [Actinomycetota bacterium]